MSWWKARKGIVAMAKAKWLIALWAISAAVVTTGWWAGLGLSAIWLMQSALF